jgi:hypothetical protein
MHETRPMAEGKMAEEQWDRLAQEAKKDKATQPEDWGSRCKKSIPIFLD